MSDALQYELDCLRFEQSYEESTQTIDEIINFRASQQRRMEREEVPFNERPMLITL